MLVVAIGVLNAVLMSILERRKEFGVLKAIGTKPIQLFQLITIETLIIGVISIVIGVCLSFGVNTYFSIYGIELEEPIKYGGMVFKEMKAIVDMDGFLTPAWVILLTSIIVSIYPAYKAAQTVPVEAMR